MLVFQHGDINTKVFSSVTTTFIRSFIFTIRSFFKNIGIFPDTSTSPELRAYHGSDLTLVFGAFSYNLNQSTIPPTDTEVTLSKYMQGALVAFARNPTRGLVDYGWPLYDSDPNSNATTLVQLGGFYNRTGASLAEGRLLDFPCSAQDTLQEVQKQLAGLLDAVSSSGS